MTLKRTKRTSTAKVAAFWLRATLLWGLLMLVWWVLTEGEDAGLIWGAVPNAFLAVWILMRESISRLQWRFFPYLILFYVNEAFKGGVDVALRAVSPQPLTRSYCMDYPLQLTTPWARSLWIGLVGLMPGTLAVSVGKKTVCLHVLDQEMRVMPTLERLEWLLQRLVGEGR